MPDTDSSRASSLRRAKLVFAVALEARRWTPEPRSSHSYSHIPRSRLPTRYTLPHAADPRQATLHTGKLRTRRRPGNPENAMVLRHALYHTRTSVYKPPAHRRVNRPRGAWAWPDDPRRYISLSQSRISLRELRAAGLSYESRTANYEPRSMGTRAPVARLGGVPLLGSRGWLNTG